MKLKFLFIIVFPFLALMSCGDDEENMDFSNTCLPTDLQAGVIAYYPFANANLEDASTNNYTLSNTTSASGASDRNGNPNCAFAFNNNLLNVEFLSTEETSFLDGLSTFSVSVWYQPINLTRNGANFEGLVNRGDIGRCPDRLGEWSVGLFDCRRAVFGHDNSVWANPVTNFSAGCDAEIEALTDEWHHVVAVKNGDTYKIYFNGVLQNTSMGDANCMPAYAAQDIGDLFLGRNFTGKMDDVIIYNREVIEEEVADLFLLAPCCG